MAGTQYLSSRPTVPVYDAYGGVLHAPDNWIEVAPGKWALSGSNEQQTYDPSAPVVNPDAAWMAGEQAKAAAKPQQASSPHFNPALAQAYAAGHPNVGTEFLSAGEAGINPSFNPDIAALAGMPVNYGWNYGAQAQSSSGAPLFAPPPNQPNNLPGGYTGQGNPSAAAAPAAPAPTDPLAALFAGGDSTLANAVLRSRFPSAKAKKRNRFPGMV